MVTGVVIVTVLLIDGRACTAKEERGRTWVLSGNRNKWWDVNVSHADGVHWLHLGHGEGRVSLPVVLQVIRLVRK